MSAFFRRFTFDPGNEVLLDIESVNILDLEPPANITGVGSGTVIMVGEFENGPFAEPLEMASGGDVSATFGGFGYTYSGVAGNHPCARTRKADGALAKEYWNGNGAVQLNGKQFARLILVRADTSIGSVEFRREAYVEGGSDFRFNLEPSQIVSLDIGAGPVSSTFTATAAAVTSGSQTYSGFVGGETLTIGYDAAPDFTVTFLAGDTTQAAVLARINAYAGFTFASAASGSTATLTGIQRGAGAQVRVTSGSAGVLTALGLTAAITLGTGNVQNIDATSFEEVKKVVEAGMSNLVTVRRNSAGNLRVSKNYAGLTDYIQVGVATTAAGLGLAVDTQGTNDGIANYRSTAESFVTTGTGTLVLGVDDEVNFNITVAASQSQATVIANINTAAGFTMASSISGTVMLLRGRASGGQVRVLSAPSGVLSDLGLTAKTITSPAPSDGTLPAGTLLQTSAGMLFVIMQDVDVTAAAQAGVTASGIGPYAVKVRHAVDDTTGASATAGTISSTVSAPDLGSFQVLNPATTSAALTESQIDAVYAAAIDSTKALDSAAAQANIIYCARQSNVVRRRLRQNVLDASAVAFGRVAVIRPPLGTTKLTARSNKAEPGVGAYRDQRVIYTFPGVNVFVPPIALRGTLGGEGFTADGNVDVGADGFMASICSQLNPEENPGQLTTFTSAVNGLETSVNAQGYEMGDYQAFKASGIAAPRMDDGVMIFQSGVTSVDPQVHPNLVNIARRRMADFIEDSVAARVKSYSKKLSTQMRRKAVLTEMRNFADELLGRNGVGTQRIAGYTLSEKDNSADTLGKGLYRITLKVRNLSSLDSIVVASTVGESVEVEEVLPQAA